MTLKFKLSEQFREAEFARTGQPVPRHITGDMDLTPKQAAELLEVSGYRSSYLLDGNCELSEVAVETTDLTDAVRQYVAKMRVRVRKQAEEKARMAAEKEAKLSENRKKYLNNEEAVRTDRPTHVHLDEETSRFVMEVQEKIKAEQRAAAEAKKEVEKKQKELMETWAREYGSDLLKARLEAGHNWLEMAQDEYAVQLLTRTGYSPLTNDEKGQYGDCWPIKDGTLEQLKLLKEVEKIDGVCRGELYRRKDADGNHTDWCDVLIRAPYGGAEVYIAC